MNTAYNIAKIAFRIYLDKLKESDLEIIDKNPIKDLPLYMKLDCVEANGAADIERFILKYLEDAIRTKYEK
jgi:hypothetical protein